MQDKPGSAAERSDAELLDEVRAGSSSAYAELHARHLRRAWVVARRLSHSGTDAEDLVSEAFTRVLMALSQGGGPDTDFRRYLITTVRHLAFDRATRGGREQPHDLPAQLDPRDAETAALQHLDRDRARHAIAQLPEHLQLILWRTTVEGRPVRELATELDVQSAALSSLAYRARERLRQAYLRTFLETATDPDCLWAIDHLAAYVRDGLKPTRRRRVGQHLDRCASCRTCLARLAELNAELEPDAHP